MELVNASMQSRYLLLTLLTLLAPLSYVQAITEPISVTDITLLGQPSAPNATVGEAEGMVQALLTNNSDVEQSFVYIAQIKDPNGYTTHLAWMDETLKPQETLTAQQLLTIETQAAYTVEIFVWSSIANPVPLSYSYNSFTFDSFGSRSPCKGAGACFNGTVDKIVDGDTIDVDGKRIRLALVNTPERDERGYAEATKFTSTVCPVGSTVLVDQDGKQMYDKYGRMVAVVYCDGALLNAELLFADHAVILEQFCRVSEFGNEDWAKLFGC